jgi:hypothetical protein
MSPALVSSTQSLMKLVGQSTLSKWELFVCDSVHVAFVGMLETVSAEIQTCLFNGSVLK